MQPYAPTTPRPNYARSGVAWLRIVVALVMALLLAFVAAELWLRWTAPAESRLPFDENPAARVHIAATTPGLSYELGTHRSSNFLGVEVRTNSRGLRDDEPRTPRAPRVVAALGDSITFGWSVGQDDAWPQALERLLNAQQPTEVDNYGVSGYSTRDQLAVLEAKVLPTKPGLIVLGFFMNDCEPHGVSPLHLAFRKDAWFTHSMLYERLVRAGRKAELRKYQGSLYRWVTDPDGPNWQAWLSVVDRFADTCRAADVPVLVAVFPAFWSYDSFEQYPWSPVHTQVVQAFEARGVQAFDLVPYFAAAGLTAASAKVDDEHPNARGHEVAAQAIAEQLQQRGLWAVNAEAPK